MVEQAASLTVLKDLCGALPGLEGGADAVREVVEKAAYMVLGLGDVYLGAPCAVPVDPRWAAVLLFCSRSGAMQLAVLYGSATPTQLTDTILSSGEARQQGWNYKFCLQRRAGCYPLESFLPKIDDKKMLQSRASGTTLHLGGHHPRTVLSQWPWLVIFNSSYNSYAGSGWWCSNLFLNA